jgi:hypothetical protein
VAYPVLGVLLRFKRDRPQRTFKTGRIIMKTSIKLTPAFALLFCGLLFVPRNVMAQIANCPMESASNVPIAYGQAFAGANCNL